MKTIVAVLGLLARISLAQRAPQVNIADIQGASFQSPLSGQYVQVSGVVTAKVCDASSFFNPTLMVGHRTGMAPGYKTNAQMTSASLLDFASTDPLLPNPLRSEHSCPSRAE